ncbi:MAG: DUF6177 family protein [Ornithinimicrobium sp.]
MSEDWLVTSQRPITVDDLVLSLQTWSGEVFLRADDTGVCTVVVDIHDRAVVWIAASQRVHEPREALLRAGLEPSGTTRANLGSAPAMQVHWTEVIQPASPHPPASLIGAGSLARAIAAVVGGSSVCLSHAPDGQSARGNAGHARAARGAGNASNASNASNAGSAGADTDAGDLPGDVPCDLVTESCAIFLQTRAVLGLTPWSVMAMDWASARGLTPVFLTPGISRLSPVMHHCASRGACLWVRQGAEGMHDGATGRAAAWDGCEFVPSAARPWPVAERGAWEVVIEGERLHPGASPVRVGDFVQAVHEACGLEGPHSWGPAEPTGQPWDVSAVNAHARSASPEQSRLVVRSSTGEAIVTVTPEPVGIQESLTCIVRADHLLPRATSLTRLGEQLLQAGSDLCVLGYRRRSLSALGDDGSAGNVLPGLICFVPARFGGLDASAFGFEPGSGVETTLTDSGVVLAFAGAGEPTDSSSAALVSAWDRVLTTVAAHDSLDPARTGRDLGKGAVGARGLHV